MQPTLNLPLNAQALLHCIADWYQLLLCHSFQFPPLWQLQLELQASFSSYNHPTPRHFTFHSYRPILFCTHKFKSDVNPEHKCRPLSHNRHVHGHRETEGDTSKVKSRQENGEESSSEGSQVRVQPRPLHFSRKAESTSELNWQPYG